jgi:hypothetical protein
MASTPSTGSASTAKTLSAVSGLPRPMPFSPMPANIWAEMATSMYVLRIVRMVKSAARPGVLELPVVSSLMVSVVSQPQKMKMESERPAAKAAKDSIAKGLSQLHEKPMASSDAPLTALPKASTMKRARTTICSPTSTYWTPFVAAMPR